MRVIGTAGHVDHGKSTLVEALTGTHPDRLKEEREREMTIDLGFAFLTLPSGEEVGIVDVPGHRDFIENMLAGVGGIDAALFVVAADEGVMPQTREHLAILDILQIQGGVVALTKTDLVADPEWLDLVEEDLHQVLSGTVLGNAEFVRVSAKTGRGVPEVITALQSCLEARPRRVDLSRPRLPVDRVFTVAGFGTVVTGTLTDGCLQAGQEVEILPSGVRGKIRGLQAHNRKEEISQPGSRTAVNISGVSLDQVHRGDWVVSPGDYSPTRRVDLHFRQIPEVTQPVTHNMEVKFFIGAAEVVGRLRLLGVETLQPGQEGWLQVELRSPVVALRGDRFILRRPSPGETLGGGMVVDPHPGGRHKRFSKTVLAGLEALAQGSPEEVLMQAMLALGAAQLKEVIERSTLATAEALTAAETLKNQGEMIFLNPQESSRSMSALVTSPAFWEQITRRIAQAVSAYHRDKPLRRGMPREELKSRLKLPPRLFNAILQKLESGGLYTGTGALIWNPDHQIRFTPPQEATIATLMEQFARAPYSPPTVKDAQAMVGGEVFAALVDLEKLVPVSPEVVFRKEDYDRLVAETIELIAEEGVLKVADFRDRFHTTRRYALAFLEHLDAKGITVRTGDIRRLKA